MGLGKTASDRFLVVGLESKETHENYVIDLQGVKGGAAHEEAMKKMVCLHKREQGTRTLFIFTFYFLFFSFFISFFF